MGGWLYVTGFAAATTIVLGVLSALQRRAIAEGPSGGNDAQRLEAAAEVVSVLMIASATVRAGVVGESAARDAVACALFGVVALGASALGARVGMRLLLGKMREELARDNKAAGVAAAGQVIASALVASRAIAGSEPRALGPSLAFFLIAEATLLAFVSLFRALTTYDDAEQIHGENLAAALSYAGATVAIGIVVASAVDGDFEGWLPSLRKYAAVLLSLLALWPVRQLLVQTVLLRAPLRARGGALDAAIRERRSTGMASLEAASYVATALAIVRLS